MMLYKLLLVSNVIIFASSLRILGLFPHPGKSHSDVFLPLVKGLAEKGHEVTVISHFPLKSRIKGYTDISLSGTIAPRFNAQSLDQPSARTVDKFFELFDLSEMAHDACTATLRSKQVQDFLSAETKFDVILMEFFNTDCYMSVVDKFKAPVVGISSCTMPPWFYRRYGSPNNPSYIPNMFMGHGDKMTFLSRVENFLATTFQDLYYNNVMLNEGYELGRLYVNNELPPINEIISNYTSLMLVNTHYTLNLPRPLVPGIVEIGGMHVDKPNKLPDNIEKWINESEHGVIYFSFGSIIKGHTFPEDKKLAFLRAFGRLPQRVLWKWENETMAEKPDNVMIQKWMPQADILSHPNVRAYIAHGGLLGTIEAVHNGVPMIVMPQFGDQHTNAKAVEASGGGVVLQLYEADEEKIYNALKTILDPNFRKGAQELSARFRDRPLPPLETAIYWVEYVARHRGARHMRTAAVDMPLYKYLLLDVIAFLTAISIGVLLIAWFITKAIFRRMFKKKTPKRKTN